MPTHPANSQALTNHTSSVSSTGHGLPSVPGLDVIEVLARGGHGTVYKARQADHDRVVALKVLDGRVVDAVAERRFDRERSILGRLSDHPAIVSLLGSGLTDAGFPYLMMELATNGSLADRLDSGPMPIDEATQMIVQLASAVERAHELGVIHCDIKPANIVCSAYGDWMLTDFGVARSTEGADTTSVCVSYAHTAPERFDGRPPTASSDVYSLASVLATALTGTEPFGMQTHEDAVATVRRLAFDVYPDLRVAGVPVSLADVLTSALSKDPGARPATASGFGALVDACRIESGLESVDVATTEGAPANDTAAVDDIVSALQPLGLFGENPPPPPGDGHGSDGDVSNSRRATPLLMLLLVALALVSGGVARFFATGDATPEVFDDVAAAVIDFADLDDGADDADGANAGGADGPGGDGDGPGGRRGNGPGNRGQRNGGPGPN